MQAAVYRRLICVLVVDCPGRAAHEARSPQKSPDVKAGSFYIVARCFLQNLYGRRCFDWCIGLQECVVVGACSAKRDLVDRRKENQKKKGKKPFNKRRSTGRASIEAHSQ